MEQLCLRSHDALLTIIVITNKVAHCVRTRQWKVRWSLRKAAGMPVRIGRSWWCLVILALLLAGCASGSFGSGTAHGTTPSAGPTSSAAGTPGSTATAGPPPSLSSLGWKQVGAPPPDAVAFAPSAPDTIYTCSGATSSGASSIIRFSVSTDGGTSWRTTNTPAQAGLCGTLRVSPTDPQAVAFFANTCRQDCGMSEGMLYYTLDAGAHWKEAISTSDTPVIDFGWVGATFFLDAAPAGTPPSRTQNLAMSANGGPFAWTSFPLPAGGIFTDDSTLYVLAGSSAPCSATAGGCDDLYRSTNLGATWTHLTPIYNGNNVQVEAFAPGGSAFLGYDVRAFAGPNTYPMVWSMDGGATWRPLPGFAAGMQAATDALIAPDGTVYVDVFDDGSSPQQQNGIYRLPPGATQWALVSPVVPAGLHLVMVSWDAGGHPAALWGLVEAQNGSGITTLWTHVP
jgi:hypothetical protein